MERLNKDESGIVLDYFHSEMELHSIARSFDSDLIRYWRPARKLRAWKLYEESLERTLQYAIQTRDVLEKHL